MKGTSVKMELKVCTLLKRDPSTDIFLVNYFLKHLRDRLKSTNLHEVSLKPVNLNIKRPLKTPSLTQNLADSVNSAVLVPAQFPANTMILNENRRYS